MNKIIELEDARNYILHGNIERIKVLKTKLPEYPLTINYEDILEELDIIINVINYFRFIIPKLDLMPQISIPILDTKIFKPLDFYFYNVLVPYFYLILNKHSLIPTRNYELKTVSLSPDRSNIAKKVSILIKAKSNNLFDGFFMNCEKSNYYSETLEKIIDKNNIEKLSKEKTFLLPKFMIN